MRRSHGPVRSSEPGNKRPVRLLRSRSDPVLRRPAHRQSVRHTFRPGILRRAARRQGSCKTTEAPPPSRLRSGTAPNDRTTGTVRRFSAPHRSHRFPWAIPSAQKASPPTSRATERATPEPPLPDTASPCRQRRKSSSRYLGSGHIWSSTISSSLSMRRRISSKHDATVSW